MLNLLNSAFNAMTKLSSRKAVIYIERPDEFAKEQIDISISNYDENNPVIDNVSTAGYQFVVSKDSLFRTNNYRTIEKTDVIHDPELGPLTIQKVKPLFAIGVLVGWRCWTG